MNMLPYCSGRDRISVVGPPTPVLAGSSTENLIYNFNWFVYYLGVIGSSENNSYNLDLYDFITLPVDTRFL
jgi:hypothetical protein